MRRKTWPAADSQSHTAHSGLAVGPHTRCKTSGRRDSQSHSSHIACLLPSRSWLPPVPHGVLVAWAVGGCKRFQAAPPMGFSSCRQYAMLPAAENSLSKRVRWLCLVDFLGQVG